MTLFATISELPPSTNKLYSPKTFKKGKKLISTKVLSDEARKYITSASTELGKQWMFKEKPEPNAPYELTLVFFLERIENKTWPAKAASRFVKRDVSNLIKVLEDIVSRASGIDDSCTLDLHVFKRQDSNNPRVEIILRSIDDEQQLGC